MSGAVKNSNPPSKAHQAQWNVQVVRGKVTTRCLWNACKALSVGLLLLTIGTTMAVIGYYADQLSIRSETRGNSTVRVKNESRGFHLNNLSYAGPIVMGVGGFIVVAACVMTFEARDSAAKVVPARFKPNLNSSMTEESTKTTPRNSRTCQRSTSAQTPAVGTCPGIYKIDSAGGGSYWSPKNDPIGRRTFTAAFVQFSRELREHSAIESNRRSKLKIHEVNLNKSPSAPDLTLETSGAEPLSRQNSESKFCGRSDRESQKVGSRRQKESVRLQGTVSSNLLLRPCHLQRQALSMDNSYYDGCGAYTPPSVGLSRQESRRSGGSRDSFEMELGSSAGISSSQTSMALDLHDCQVTLKVKDESANKRSDTARRHQLLRQKPVDDDVVPRCAHIPRLFCGPAGEECKIRTNSSINLQSPCHHCLKSGRSHSPKMTAHFRSQSFTHTCSPKNCTHNEFNTKIFCVEDHRRANLSSENVRLCCEEKHRFPRRHSPSVSPHRSPRTECRVLRLEGAECLVHRTRDKQSKSKKRKTSPKMEGSQSVEEPHRRWGKRDERARSASFSPTRKKSPTTPPSREGSPTPEKKSSAAMGETKDEGRQGKFEPEPS